MKIKKVLCSVLATVMAASVLSVGMVSVASAAEAAEPTGNVATGSYEFNVKTLTDAATAESKGYGNITFGDIHEVQHNDILLGKDSTIKFKVDGTNTYLTVLMDSTSDYGVQIADLDGATNITKDTTTPFLLTSGTTYTLKTVDNIGGNYARLDGLMFTAGEPKLEILYKGKTGQKSDAPTGVFSKTNVSFAKLVKGDSTTYYGIALFDEETANKYSKVTVKATNDDGAGVEITKVYKSIEIDGVEYGPSILGTGAQYLYAFNLGGTLLNTTPDGNALHNGLASPELVEETTTAAE